MTNKQYKELKEEYERKVCFVWSHWIDKSMSYDHAKDIIIQDIKEEGQRIIPTNDDGEINM